MTGDAGAGRPEDGRDIPPGLGALALEALRWNWGKAYEIGWDVVRCWHARRLDGLGGDILGDDPDALRTAIWADYQFLPVPRDLPAVLP